jgi:hypothetical protein
MPQMVEHLPSKFEALSSKTTEKERGGWKWGGSVE